MRSTRRFRPSFDALSARIAPAMVLMNISAPPEEYKDGLFPIPVSMADPNAPNGCVTSLNPDIPVNLWH